MENKTTVTYLGHSAFLIETEKYYLFFDYVGTTEYDEYRVEQMDIDFNDYQNKKILMFSSHDHFDHYNNKLHQETNKYKNIVTILGDIESNLNDTITIKPRETVKIEDVTIYTGDSTDMGVCYLVDINGLSIFHSGDNALWSSEDKLYYKEIDYISSLKTKIDLAFIPVCSFFGTRTPSLTEGAVYAIKKLSPKLVFPMHSTKETTYKEFKEDALKNDCYDSEIICMDEQGQTYTI